MIGQGVPFSLSSNEVDAINNLFSASDLLPIESSMVRVHLKAKVNGHIYSSKEYKRALRQNNYTISFSSSESLSVNYGIVEKFLMVNGNPLAIVTNLIVCCHGPPHQFQPNTLTADTQKVIFDDYLQYNFGDKQYIFARQIVSKFCNLSSTNCNMLTAAVNSSELE